MRSLVSILILMLACSVSLGDTGALRPTALPQVESGVIGWEVGGPLTDTVAQVRQQLPTDDSGKWFVTVFVSANCPGCAPLVRDFKTNPYLDALTFSGAGDDGWAHFNLYEWSEESDRFRFTDFSVTQVPVIFVSPPRNHPTYPNCTVFKRSGYSGDAKGLAVDIVKAVRGFVETMVPSGRRRRQFPFVNPQPTPQPFRQPNPPDCPWCDPVPNTNPTPVPLPFVNPKPYVDPWKDLLNFPPDDEKEDGDKKGEEDAEPGEYPDYTQVVLIVDPQNTLEEETTAKAKSVLAAIADKYGGPKVDVVSFDEATKDYPDVRRTDTPVVIITSQGRILAQMSTAQILSLAEKTLESDDDSVWAVWWNAGVAAIVGVPLFLLLVVAVVLMVAFAFYRNAQNPQAEPDGTTLTPMAPTPPPTLPTSALIPKVSRNTRAAQAVREAEIAADQEDSATKNRVRVTQQSAAVIAQERAEVADELAQLGQAEQALEDKPDAPSVA